MHDTRVCATSCVKYFVKRRLNDLCKCYVMLAKHSVELFSQKKKKCCITVHVAHGLSEICGKSSHFSAYLRHILEGDHGVSNGYA